MTISEAATSLLLELRRRASANAQGRCWINCAGIYDASGVSHADAPAVLQELIDHADVILESKRDGGWLLLVVGEMGPS